jgi:hypothetical protein
MKQLFASVSVMCLIVSSARAEDLLFAELLHSGVRMESGATMKLPPPTLPDGLSAADQQKILAQLADDRHPVEALLRKSVVAPFVLKITDDPSAAGQTSRACHIDLWFVAYADLARVSDEKFVRQQFEAETSADASNSSSQLVALSPADLTARHITTVADERIFAGTIDLFDRVRLTAAIDGRQSRTDESVVVAISVDPRFSADAEFPNSWRNVTRGTGRALQLGAAQPYQAAGGYMKASRLAQPSGALLIEYHLVFEEPQGWFRGSNLLRSKLPLLCQDGVRTFRRRMSAPLAGR